MRCVNLIPVRRLMARQQRRHVRRCALACAVWAAMALSVCAAGSTLFSAGGDDIQSQIEKVDREIELARSMLNGTRAELATAKATLRAIDSIANQPDWSLLLALLGSATRDDVLLRSFEFAPLPPEKAIAPSKGAAPAGRDAQGTRYLLKASGLGQSQPAVTQFVLRLEDMGLFSRVTLLDTSREPFLDGQATGFRIECVLGGDEGPTAVNGGNQ